MGRLSGLWMLAGFGLALAAAPAVPVAAAGAAVGDIQVVAGGGTCSPSNPYGDGGPATQACLIRPFRAVATADGGILIADTGANRVHRVGPDGIFRTVAGSGPGGLIPGNYGGDGGPAGSARLSAPLGVAPLPNGGLLIADTENGRIREVAPDGTITTTAGGGVGGDGCLAPLSFLSGPGDVAATGDGGFLIADTNGSDVRRVRSNGTIDTVAGDGGGSDNLAIRAGLVPADVAPLADGGFLIADELTNRIWRVAPDGRMTAVAGNGRPELSGDGGPATQAAIDDPTGVAATSDGGFVIADGGNDRIRYVSPQGTITTIAGSGGTAGSTPALSVRLGGPAGVALMPAGGVLIADRFNNRVLLVDSPLRPAAVSGTSSSLPTHVADLCGGLDAAFGTGGTARVPAEEVSRRTAMMQQHDGKLVFGGGHTLARLDVRGGLDRSFGSGGTLQTVIGQSVFDVAALALQGDGKLLAAGSGEGGAAVLRYTSSGALDTGFGSGGSTVVPIPGSSTGSASALAVQPDGKIVVAATANDGSPASRIYLFRLLPGGQLDSSFGSGGLAAAGAWVVHALVIQPDDKIVVSGSSGLNAIILRRFVSDGAPDTSFGTNGVVATQMDQQSDLPALALQRDGKLVVAGYVTTPDEMLVARYRADGQPDPAFGHNGLVRLGPRVDRFSSGPVSAGAAAVALQGDDKILVGGSNIDGQVGAPRTFSLVRLLSDGELDSSFGGDGRLLTRMGILAAVRAIALTSDGAIVAGGYSIGSSDEFAVARYAGLGASPAPEPGSAATAPAGGQPPSGAGNSPPSGAGTSLPRGPRLVLRVLARLRLRALLAHGLVVEARDDRAAVVRLRLLMSPAAARRSGARHVGGPVVIARGGARLTAPGAVRVRLRVTRRGRAALRHVRSARVVLVGTDHAGGRATVRLRLRR